MRAQRCRRTFATYRGFKRRPHRRAFVDPRHAAEKFASAEQGGYRERDRMSRHVFQRREASIEDLLLTAHLVQGHHFDWKRILQVRWRIIKGEMSIGANAEQH